jgi:hypothetical protein
MLETPERVGTLRINQKDVNRMVPLQSPHTPHTSWPELYHVGPPIFHQIFRSQPRLRRQTPLAVGHRPIPNDPERDGRLRHLTPRDRSEWGPSSNPWRSDRQDPAERPSRLPAPPRRPPPWTLRRSSLSSRSTPPCHSLSRQRRTPP